MGSVFKLFGKEFAEKLIQTTDNPFVGLFIGILVTSIVQSSSTTTSMIVGLVASDALPVRSAIPMIMGANIGTAVTATIVALGHVTRKEEFRRAFACASVHDFFNLIVTCILLPLELTTHFLERLARSVTILLSDMGGVRLVSPIKLILEPVVHGIKTFFVTGLGLGNHLSGILILVISFVLLFVSLRFMMTTMRGVMLPRAETAFHKVLMKAGVLGIFVGAIITASVQSSSVTTSLMVPMAAAGIVSLEQVFPIILGANIGTTVTALLASLAGNQAAVTIALVHLFFNVTGICLIYPFRRVRMIPLRMANFLAERAAERKRYAVFFVLGVFFILPGIFIFVFR